MFSKIFSNKAVDEDKKEMINRHLDCYRSDAFPKGILFPEKKIELTVDKDKTIAISFTLPFPCNGELEQLSADLSLLLKQKVRFSIQYDVFSVREHALKGIKNIIAIASGKGGVGKSTTAVNLAYALMAEGAKVGVLDADIYGPSIPTLLGLQGQKPSSVDGKLITPFDAHGLSAMSIGFMVDDNDATVWRGPMASRAFSQLLNETAWHELDYLIVDMPPGTGDIQLTLAQQVPVAAAVIITTPQDIALKDAIKGIAMFNKVKLPVLGIIENMSYHQCSNCGHQSHVFGKGGGENIAQKYDTQLLGQLPLDIEIREDADSGNSIVIKNSTSDITLQYRNIARKIAAQLFLQYQDRISTSDDIIFKVKLTPEEEH
ncbi:MAG: ATP-binding protein involved in chromosome partitioning [Alteromonadaceae bacterium]|jgi:ATP-binding protein involved in chromosome partitioning